MKKIFYTLAILTLALTSCKKKGCTDSTATNRNEKAKKDDGSCLYRPFLTINGQAQMTINVGGAYSDAGATAVNKDGSSVVVSSETAGCKSLIISVMLPSSKLSHAAFTAPQLE